jgi:hypothetical protein
MRQMRCEQGCQIFLRPIIPRREKCTKGQQTMYTKRPYIIPIGHKLYQMAVKIYQHFPFQGPQNIPEL